MHLVATEGASQRANLAALAALARAHPGEVAIWPEGLGELARAVEGDPGLLDHPPAWALRPASPPAVRRVVFLDRDGTLIEDRHYLNDPAGLVLLPGAVEGLQSLARQGCRLVVVTNQSGVARGFVSARQLEAVHARLREALGAHGLVLDGIFTCIHDALAGCGCRKPGTGLVVQAATELGLELRRGLVVGDKASDLELARRLGLPAVLVATGKGVQTFQAGGMPPDYLVQDLAELARMTEHPAGLPIPERLP